MKICFVSSAHAGHNYPYYRFVELLIQKGHTVDWYGVEDKSRIDPQESIRATGASYTQLPEITGGDLLMFFKFFKNDYGFFQAFRIMYMLVVDKLAFDMWTKAQGQDALNKFLMLAWHATGATRGAQLKVIQQEKKYELLLVDVVSIPDLIALSMDIPFIAMTPMIVDMKPTGGADTMLRPSKVDEYCHYLLNKKVSSVCYPSWTYEKSIHNYDVGAHCGITLSSWDLYTIGGQSTPPGNTECTWYISNREFEIKSDLTKQRPVKEVQAKPRVYISFGTEMCNNYPLIDAFFEYFGNGEEDCIFTFGGNKISYDMYKDRKWKNPDFRIELLVNQKEILASGVDIYFNHCGAGSIYESIFYAVPMICIPQEWDQPANAKSISDLGCAIIFDESPKTDVVSKIAERMNTMLAGYDGFRTAMRKQQQIFMNGNTTGKVIDEALAAFKENPSLFKIGFDKVSLDAPKIEFEKRMGMVGNYDVCVWFLLILSVIVGFFRYMS